MVGGKHSDTPWWQRETVRVRGYTVATAVVGLVVLREWVTAEEAGYIMLAVAAIFGVYGIESSRSKTTPDAVVRKEIIPRAAAGRNTDAQRIVDTGIIPEVKESDSGELHDRS